MADASTTPRQLTPEAPESNPEPQPPHRYAWLGTFGERYEEDGSKWIEAFCGCCYTEISQAWRDLEPRCPFCKTRCWAEPLICPQGVAGEQTGSATSSQSRPATPMPEKAEQEPIQQGPAESSRDLLLSPSKSSSSEDLCAAVVAMTIQPVVAGKTSDVPSTDDENVELLLKMARGRGRIKSESQGEKSSTSSTGSGMLLKSVARRRYPKPNWGLMDMGPLPKCTLPEGEHRFEPMVPVTPPTDPTFCFPPEWPSTPPPPHAVNKDTFCWVAPGRADPERYRAVSRVQRLINTRVFEKWGFYMPYAPEWVFDEIAKHVDEWIYGELIRREKTGLGGVFKKDREKRHRDVDYLYDIAQEWWFGRTILKHGVKSCGKHQEERNFSLSSDLPSGGRIDKPHPAYYVSYEVTKAKYERNMH
uniref:Uncharacterized protein n=1 Tax=Xenopus tropicalis TaxID=8364 RepID=A0A1B8XT28_XENTR